MYHEIQLKQIDNKNQNISTKQIMRALNNCYKKYAFSTFPYIYEELSSYDSLKKYNSGNCIALSMSIKDYLKENYNVDSYLIPASIPKKYSYQGYLKLSHVSLLIPKSKEISYIADPAFYFLNPIKSKKNMVKGISKVYSKNIYEEEHQTNPENYNSIDKVVYEEGILLDDEYLNKYQTIPKSTKYSEVNYTDDISDKWRYYMIEVSNPDKAISNFFINIIKRPFIVTTKIDKNGICCMDIYLKLVNTNRDILLEITHKNKKQIINLNNISDNELKTKLSIYEKKLAKFFNGKLVDILLNCKDKLNKGINCNIND
jgi:hypothetical protein